MSSFNNTTILGHLTADFELRFLPNGTAVAKTSIAVNRSWKSESGEKKEDVCFIPLEVWRGAAETLAQHTRKGDPLLVSGRLAQENWEDKATHQPRSRLKLVVETFTFVKGKAAGDAPASASPRPAPGYTQPGYQPQGAAAPAQQQEANPGPEDDISF